MGMMTKFRNWLRPQPPVPPARSEPARRPAQQVIRPVAIDLHSEDEADDELEHFDPSGSQRPPRSRQELIAELQRNYQEVLGIVRRVGQHLDEQGERSRRLADIAERFPAAADDLTEVRRGQAGAAAAMEALAEALAARDERLARGHGAQLERLEEIHGLLAESSQAERELIGSLIEFRSVMGGMTAATDKLTEAVGRIERREEERAGEFLKALEVTRSWLITIAVVGGLCAVVALGLGIAAWA